MLGHGTSRTARAPCHDRTGPPRGPSPSAVPAHTRSGAKAATWSVLTGRDASDPGRPHRPPVSRSAAAATSAGRPRGKRASAPPSPQVRTGTVGPTVPRTDANVCSSAATPGDRPALAMGAAEVAPLRIRTMSVTIDQASRTGRMRLPCTCAPAHRHLGDLETQPAGEHEDPHVEGEPVHHRAMEEQPGHRRAKAFEAALGVAQADAGDHVDRAVEHPAHHVATHRVTLGDRSREDPGGDGDVSRRPGRRSCPGPASGRWPCRRP